MYIDCGKLLLDDHTRLLGDNLAPDGLCFPLWIDPNEAPEIIIVQDQRLKGKRLVTLCSPKEVVWFLLQLIR